VTTTQDRQVDIVDLLIEDHRTAAELLARFDGSLTIEQRERLFRGLTTTLVQHEMAEEETIYPAVRERGPDAAAIVDARIAEQAEAQELLRFMETIDTMSDDFVASFAKLRAAVLAHADTEEAELFPLLADGTPAADREQMARRYERARDRAPTHPHPNAPHTPPGNLVFDTVAALTDRVRDAFRPAVDDNWPA